MKKFISKYKWPILATLTLICLYWFTRLINLGLLPIFTDEAIYIRWSQIGGNDANWRFISLTDGKQPLFTWIMMGTLRFFTDPLIAGRMVSVISGFMGLLGIAALSYEIFKSKKITLTAMFLYIITPFNLMYDRLAVYDSLSSAITLWSIFLAIKLARRVKLDTALLFGISLGFGMLNKTSGFIAVYLLPFTLLVFDWKAKNRYKTMLRWACFGIIAFVVSQGMYGVLRLSPFYHMIAQKDFVFVHPFKNWYFLYPFFVGNLKGLMEWLISYISWPVFTLAIISPIIVLQNKKLNKNVLGPILLLLIYCFLPLVGLAYFGKVLYPRFILFMTTPLLILCSYVFIEVFQKIKRQWYCVFFTVIVLFLSLKTDYYILTNPKYAPIPQSDRSQLIDDWPSGYGVPQVVSFIRNEISNKEIAVFTEGTFGLFPYALEIYFVDNPNIKIQGIWPLPENMPESMRQSAMLKPTYFILNQTQLVPKNWPIKLLEEFQKGTNSDIHMRLFQVIASNYAMHEIN